MIDVDTEELQHSYGVKIDGVDRCPLCPGPHGGAGPCDLSRYGGRHRRFVRAHMQEFIAIYENPDQRYASALRTRLTREEATLPFGHYCWCVCPREDLSRGYPACSSCLELRRDQKSQEAAAIGHTAAVHAPTPYAEMLDFMAGLM